MVIESFGVGGLPIYENSGLPMLEVFGIKEKQWLLLPRFPTKAAIWICISSGLCYETAIRSDGSYSMTLEAVIKLRGFLAEPRTHRKFGNYFYKPIQKESIGS